MAIHKLGDDISDKRLKALIREPGKHSDGGGLYLQVAAAGQGSWVVRFGERWKSLGPADEIDAATARAQHAAMKAEKRAGRDPLGAKAINAGAGVPSSEAAAPGQASEAAAGITRVRFADVVEMFLTDAPAVKGWKTKSTEPRKYRKLKDGALGKLWADDITSGNVADELKARWGDALASADKNRMRIKLVCDFARAKGFRHRDATNPANNDDLKNLIAKPPKSVPHPSLPVAECPAFFAELVADGSNEARSLAFLILTTARTAEARDVDWREIKGNVWTIPGGKDDRSMKEGVEHSIPLSDAALALLGPAKTSGRIFGTLPHDALDDKLKEYRALGVATVHGFRASFNGWAVKAGYPKHLWGRALAHATGNKTDQAYDRDRLIEERRPMMVAYANYLTG